MGAAPAIRSIRPPAGAAVLAATGPRRGAGAHSTPEPGTGCEAPPGARSGAGPCCSPCSSRCDSCRRRCAYDGGSLIRLRTRCS
eukprot:6273496-Alexandrium_andersonii.AAC.1